MDGYTILARAEQSFQVKYRDFLTREVSPEDSKKWNAYLDGFMQCFHWLKYDKGDVLADKSEDSPQEKVNPFE